MILHEKAIPYTQYRLITKLHVNKSRVVPFFVYTLPQLVVYL